MFETKSIFRKRIKNIFLCAIAEQPSSFVCLFVCFLTGIYNMQGCSLQGMELKNKTNKKQTKKMKHKNIKAQRKFLSKERTVNRCLLILDLNPFRS